MRRSQDRPPKSAVSALGDGLISQPINAVDEDTQYEIICAVEKISERYLIPVLAQLLDQFPFIISCHADNGSEYINQQVVKRLKMQWRWQSPIMKRPNG